MTNEALNPKPNQSPERFESDSQKIVRRHLQNEKDVITEDDIRGVRIGIMPQEQDNTEEKLEELTDEIKNKDKDVESAESPITPWDTIQQ